MALLTTEDKLLRRINQRFAKGVVKYGLIEDDDKILVGLSGGKDSMALLELLALRSRIHKPRFSLMAVHVGMTNIAYRADLDYLKAYSEGLGVPFVHYETSFDPAKEHGCNKIALGHHMDDILQTLLMNITFQGAFSSMPPKLVMHKFDMTLIRPLCLVHEADLEELAALRGYRKQVKNCPYETASNRAQMKDVLRRLEELNPEARYSLWGSMTNVQEELLPSKID